MESLTEIGTRYGTDKVRHGFCEFYDRFLDEMRGNAVKILEIGVHRGASLLMWHDYFREATIHGMDLSVTPPTTRGRIHLHAGDQANRESLEKLVQQIGSNFDLIIDDGGHTMEQQQVSLGVLFPHVRPGGCYIIEDLHTSFIEEIPIYRGGERVGSYPTGVASGVPTTYEIVDAIRLNKNCASSFMSQEECEYIVKHVEQIEMFDRDADKKHMTSLMYKKNRESGSDSV